MKHFLLVGFLALAGCAAPYNFPAPGPAWQTHVGQLQSTTRGKSVIGEVVVSRGGPAEFQLDFLSGPGFPILKVRVLGERGRAESAFARASWQGNPKRAPAPLRGWLALPEIFSAAENSRPGAIASTPAGQWSAQVEKVRGRLTQLRVEFPSRGESLRFQFRP